MVDPAHFALRFMGVRDVGGGLFFVSHGERAM